MEESDHMLGNEGMQCCAAQRQRQRRQATRTIPGRPPSPTQIPSLAYTVSGQLVPQLGQPESTASCACGAILGNLGPRGKRLHQEESFWFQLSPF